MSAGGSSAGVFRVWPVRSFAKVAEAWDTHTDYLLGLTDDDAPQ